MKQYSSLRPNSDPLGEHIEKTLIQLAGTCGNTQCGAQGMISCVSGLPGLLLYIYIYIYIFFFFDDHERICFWSQTL